jgi:hypothetical protein
VPNWGIIIAILALAGAAAFGVLGYLKIFSGNASNQGYQYPSGSRQSQGHIEGLTEELDSLKHHAEAEKKAKQILTSRLEIYSAKQQDRSEEAVRHRKPIQDISEEIRSGAGNIREQDLINSIVDKLADEKEENFGPGERLNLLGDMRNNLQRLRQSDESKTGELDRSVADLSREISDVRVLCQKEIMNSATRRVPLSFLNVAETILKTTTLPQLDASQKAVQLILVEIYRFYLPQRRRDG